MKTILTCLFASAALMNLGFADNCGEGCKEGHKEEETILAGDDCGKGCKKGEEEGSEEEATLALA